MEVILVFSFVSDFGGQLDVGQLGEEILEDNAISKTAIDVSRAGDVVTITFDEALSAGETTSLNTLMYS